MKHTIRELQELQALPLDLKVRLTKQRIREWIREFGEDGVYVSFSGGKDSTVLLDIVREEYPNVKAVFVDVPTQYPELKQFVQKFDNVDIIRPKMNFFEVYEKYGFPLISKEVSECVEGARKYLTSLLKSESVLTDRQTDRQTDSESLCLGICGRNGSIQKTKGQREPRMVGDKMDYP
jgi:3'-phosphoadenosine 5'-phosphosulfate sulfotransferase (PAPS reductase)/FAD synthetase